MTTNTSAHKGKRKRSFSYVILNLLSIICFVVGILLLFATTKVALHTIYGLNGSITNTIIKFLGSAYILISFLLQTVKSSQGKGFIIAIIGLNIFGFINLYLLFLFNQLINLSSIYFILQSLIQLCLLFTLIERFRK